MVEDGAIVQTQDVESTVLATSSHNRRSFSIHLNGHDLRGIADGLVLETSLWIISGHSVVPDIVPGQLRNPFLMTVACVDGDDR